MRQKIKNNNNHSNPNNNKSSIQHGDKMNLDNAVFKFVNCDIPGIL